MGGTKVARSKKVKYLGVWIDDGLTWQDQVEAVRRKCFAGLAKLKRLRNVLPSSTKKRIFCALVQPHLDYCSVVWQECSLALQLRLNRIQNYGMLARHQSRLPSISPSYFLQLSFLPFLHPPAPIPVTSAFYSAATSGSFLH